MKTFVRRIGILIVVTLMIVSIPSISEAKSASKVLSSAVKKMKKATSIAYSYKSSINYSDSTLTSKRIGNCISDSKVDYGIYLETEDEIYTWEEYSKKNALYRKAPGDIQFTKYKRSGNTKSEKSNLEDTLKHLKSIKFKSVSSKNYVITGKPDYKGAGSKKLTITVNKKTGRITKVKFDLAKRTRKYLDESGTYVVKGGTVTDYNICYGDESIALPTELKGK